MNFTTRVLEQASGIGYSNGSLGSTEFWNNVNPNGSQMWQENSGSTGSSGTGPSSANSGSRYMYLEATSKSGTDFIESNSISNQNISIFFSYHMYGSHMGTLTTVIQWKFMDYKMVYVWKSRNSWSTIYVDLSNYTVTKLRFAGTRGNGYQSDMALDDIVVYYQNSCTYNWTTTAVNGTSGWNSTTQEDLLVSNVLSMIEIMEIIFRISCWRCM